MKWSESCLVTLGFINSLEQFTEWIQGNTFTTLLKDIFRIQMSNQRRRCIEQGLQESQAQEVPAPWSWGVFPSQCGCLHLWKASEGVLWHLPSGRHDQSLTPFFSPSPFPREWALGLKIPSLKSWLGLSSDQPSSRSPPRVPSWEQKTPGLQEPCIRNQGWRWNIRTKEALTSLGIYKCFRSSVSGTRAREQYASIFCEFTSPF